jgi:tRNA(Ile)-lysidine synthase
MAMMHLVARWCDLLGTARAKVTVLTVDHRLRPGSEAEARLVAASASALGFASHILAWDADKPQTAVQSAARAARYALLTDTCKTLGIPALLTAHTLDDQAETFVMRLKRGSGLNGLAGIPLETSLHGVSIIRPLLAFRKSTLVRHLKECGQPFVDDPSNDSPRFERGRLRPTMRALQKAGVSAAAMALSARRLQRCRTAFDALVQRDINHALAVSPLGELRLPSVLYMNAPEEMQVRYLAAMLQLMRGEAFTLNLSKLETAASLLHTDGDRITLAGCLAVRESDSICVAREVGRMGENGLILEPGGSAVWDNRYRVTLDSSAPSPVNVRELSPSGWQSIRKHMTGIKANSIAYHAALATPAAYVGERLVASLLAPANGAAFQATLLPRFAPYLR